MPAYGQNNCILETIRFENIELNSRTFEGTRTDKSNSRTFEGFENMYEPCIQYTKTTNRRQCMHLQSYMYTFTKLQ